MAKTRTLKHTESIDDLLQMSDAMEQDLDEAVRLRTDELLEEKGISGDDIIDYDSSIQVIINIKYQKNRLINSYKDGKCPDCKTKIPKDTQDGDECGNCGHVFYIEH